MNDHRLTKPLNNTLVSFFILCFFARSAIKADEPNDVTTQRSGQLAFFEQKIRPVLIEHCYECHATSAESVKGGLLLDSLAGWQAGGDSATAAIVPGEPDESLLIQAVRYQDGLEMPPDAKLDAAAIADLEAWVRDGALDPRTSEKVEVKRGDKSWWSLQRLRKFEVKDEKEKDGRDAEGKATEGTRLGEPCEDCGTIDDFVAQELERQGLVRNPPADARTLIRRMSYDVIGLPPTPEEVRQFGIDYAANPREATVRLVDRLLASPHYGEQWGRHWLDVVRFGESIGFERNVIIDDLWPFRDYVIRSINEDKPFNQFIVEHLAGDVIGAGRPEIEVGAAFLVAGPYDDVGNQDVVAQANIRAATLDEIITATSGAFLGLTINCARCHHHKFDPIPTEDYYRLRAAFEGVQHGRRVVATPTQKQQHAAAVKPLVAERKALAAQIEVVDKDIAARATEALHTKTFLRTKIDPQLIEERFPSNVAKYIKLVMLASTDNPQSAVGSRLVEVELWTAEPTPRNVALATGGATVSGTRSSVAEDFPDAYGPQFTIDGATGEQWFIGNPAELLIELPQVSSIDRISFSNAKGKNLQDKAQGATPCEYEVWVSSDALQWEKVADSFDREPWSEAHGIQRLRSQVITPAESHELSQLHEQLAIVEAKLNAIAPLPVVFVGKHEQPQQATYLHIGGDPMKPGEVVPPSSLQVLDQTTSPYTLGVDAPEAERRLALAKWITTDDNPLTARVLANRVWQYHFGTGIVDTPSDFGFLGSRPTHPELLDWLASQLIVGGWQLKPLHRQILLSKTYCQSSSYREQAAALDRDSRLLWRFPPRRLTAEEIRDTMLLVAGKLRGYVGTETRGNVGEDASEDVGDLKPSGGAPKFLANSATESIIASDFSELAGGPGFRLYKFTQNNVCTFFPLEVHGPETYRRAVYHQNARASVVDLLTDFDLPDIAFAAPVRAKTTTPLQALTLLNHPFTLDMASALAQRATLQSQSVQSETTQPPMVEPAQIVNAMYWLLLQREPMPSERAAAAGLIEQQSAEVLGRAMLNLNEVLYVE